MSITSLILDKIKSVQNMEQHSHGAGVQCTLCQLPLTDPISQEAGYGLVCRSRARFAEKLSREQLAEVEGKSEPVSQMKGNIRSVILRIKGEESPRFVTFVSRDDLSVTFWDHNEYDKNYESGMSVADSLLKSWYHIESNMCDTFAPVVEPKEGTLATSFKDFDKSIRDDIKAREKETSNMTIRKESKKHLDDKQVDIRKKLITNMRSENSKSKNKWESGEYPMATFMARLSTSSLSGSKELMDVLKTHHEFESKDFGLTDSEITHGFQQATMPLERKLFDAVIKGKADLLQLAEAYKNVKESPSPEHFKKFLELTKML